MASYSRFGGESDQQIHLKLTYIFVAAMHFKPFTLQPCYWGFLTMQTRILFFPPLGNVRSWKSTWILEQHKLRQHTCLLLRGTSEEWCLTCGFPYHFPRLNLRAHTLTPEVKSAFCSDLEESKTPSWCNPNLSGLKGECRTEAVYSRTEQYMKEPVAALG